MSSDAPKVGYKSPPTQHRFQKGKSGNPRGRPAKSQNRTKRLVQGLNACVLAEAERPITVREGDQTSEMTVREAAVRTIAVKAMKGDRSFARLFQQLMATAERAEAEVRRSLFNAMCDYKDYWEKEFARCDRAGLPRPEQLPHPADIELYPLTDEVRIVGPTYKEEKALIDRRISDRDGMIAMLENPSKLEIDDPNEKMEVLIMLFHDVRDINASLPPRLRRPFEGVIDCSDVREGDVT